MDYTIPCLVVCVLLSIPCAFLYAWLNRKRHPMILPCLFAIILAIIIIIAAVPLGLLFFQNFLPIACGDGAIGDALIYIFGGYAMSLLGLVLYQVFSILFKRWPRIIFSIAIVSLTAVLLGIFAFTIAIGLKQVLFMLYWFVMLWIGFFVMLLTDALICKLIHRHNKSC
jgi:drug/metabolite transporter (DMT)-like permease